MNLFGTPIQQVMTLLLLTVILCFSDMTWCSFCYTLMKVYIIGSILISHWYRYRLIYQYRIWSENSIGQPWLKSVHGAQKYIYFLGRLKLFKKKCRLYFELVEESNSKVWVFFYLHWSPLFVWFSFILDELSLEVISISPVEIQSNPLLL